MRRRTARANLPDTRCPYTTLFRSLGGMGAIVLDGAVVKKHAFIGAGALGPPGRTVGEGELWVGNPARKMRGLSDAEIEGLHYSAGHYVRLKDEYLAAGTP